MTEKEEKRIITIMTNIHPDKEKSLALDEVFNVYNSYKHLFFKQSLTDKNLTEKAFRHNSGKLDRRWSRSIEEDFKGMKDSIQANRKNYITDKEDKVKSVNKEIEKIRFSYNNAKKHKEHFYHKLPSLLKTLRYLSRRKTLLENSLKQLKHDYDNERFSICFGSRKLFNLQYKKHVTHSDWKRKWHESRNHSFRLTGAKHENCGNSNAQLRLVKNNNYQLKLRLPLCMEEQYGKYLLIDNISFSDKRNDIIQQAVLNNQSNDTKVRLPLTVSVSKIKGKYRLSVQLKPVKAEVVTTDIYGVVGIDMNEDNFAVAETDQNGKIIETKIFRFDLKNKSSGQRQNIIIDNMNKAIDYALSKGKNLVYEDLDFRQKKQQLYKSKNKVYNQMLSSFSYKKMTEQLKAGSYRKGIKVCKINPAYTSLVGRLCHSKKYGLSVHESAAYTIARKYYQIKEVIKEFITINHLGKTFMFTVPEKILNSEGDYQLSQLKKWYNNLFKSQSLWKVYENNPSMKTQMG